ncbi:hypothetical protein CRE_20267 [Caenorhabditis remanei]|uniref:Phosphatidylinositol-glycan biosynthesis class X protein n=1 Tax=Caenorhabditis remanei TaxID=31234 RepID=E3MD07_CAERE|nr:hypothetical protein CRE_20267 [Caenorhabditis remanei]
MNFTLICNLLLFGACYKLFRNWEIPVNLWYSECIVDILGYDFIYRFDPFRVVGGFPTLIDSFFENIFEKTTEASKSSNFLLEDLQYPVLSSQFRRFCWAFSSENTDNVLRKLNWECPILESSNQCITVVKASGCLESSQLSYNFWEIPDSSIECFHVSKGSIDCLKPFLRGNICENVVTSIGRNGNNSTFIEVDDIFINTQVIQKYAEESEVGVSKTSKNTSEVNEYQNSSFCKNYSIHETVLVGGENGTSNAFIYIFAILPFGINSTNLLKTTFPIVLSSISFRTYRYLTPNSTFCGSSTVSIYHTRGFVYSAVVTSSPSESSDSDSQKHTILYFDLPQTPPRSKFELQRGRFHCPSETACITEILYPFIFLDSIELPYQIGILVVSALLGIVILSKLNNE